MIAPTRGRMPAARCPARRRVADNRSSRTACRRRSPHRAPSSEPPLPGTPLTVSYVRRVSKSHTSLPSPAANARMWPSIEPENTAPGIAVTEPGCAGVQPARAGVQGAPAANHTFLAREHIDGGEPAAELRIEVCVAHCGLEALPVTRTGSATDAYTLRPSLAMPHGTPPPMPPLPTRVSHSSLPPFAGSSPNTMPDFWPATSTSRPLLVCTRIAGAPKS